jgi:RsiW-degrading membrane proteinase PrsW (M82 family)
MTCDKCLKKLTARNFITIATVATFLALVFYTVIHNPDVLENSIVTFILGTFVSVVTMIYQFYYRKNKTRPEFDERYEFRDGDDECPCCGQKLRKR